MMSPALLSPSEVAALAGASKVVVEKAMEQRVLGPVRPRHEGAGARRLLPLHAVALAATVKSLGRRLSVSDKRLVARSLAGLTATALKAAEVEVTPGIIVRVGVLASSAIERAERYLADRESFIESTVGVMGGRPVIRGTRITVSAVHGRLLAGETIEDLIEDYPDIPRAAFEAASFYAQTHPQVGRPVSRQGSPA